MTSPSGPTSNAAGLALPTSKAASTTAAQENPNFRMTEIGEIPEGWKIMLVANCIRELPVPHKPSIPQSGYKLSGRYPVIDQGNNLIAGYTDDESSIYRDYLPLIIFGDHTRILKFEESPFATGADGTKILFPNREIVEPKFLYYALKTLPIKSLGYNRHFKILKEHCIPIPTNKNEQRAIAAVLSKIQDAAETQRKIVAKLRELKAATMAKLFREGLNGEKLKKTEIGEMPIKWNVAKLEDICLKTGTMDPRKLPCEEFQYIDVSAVSNENFRVTSTATHTAMSAPSRARKPVIAGDVIVATVRPTLKRIAYIPKKLSGQIVSTAFCVLRANRDKALPEYIYYAIQRPEFFEALGAIQHGASYPAVTDRDVLHQQVPLPGMEEQKQIGSIFSHIDYRIKAAEAAALAFESLFASALSVLISGRLRIR